MSSNRENEFPIWELPLDVLGNVFKRLDAKSLVHMELASRAFRVRHSGSRIRMTELAAREAYEAQYGPRPDHCWKDPSWKASLHSEEASVGFNIELAEKEGFEFKRKANSTRLGQVKLVGLGPKMLVSDKSTNQQSLMRWQLRVKGNTAVEFGIVPVALQDKKKALHKCLTETEQLLCVGFSSQITVGSQLPFRCPVVKGTIVEIIVENGKAKFLVLNPSDGWDVRWENDRRVHSQYRGPSEIRFTQEFQKEHDVKLALTAWAKAEFDVLHSTECKSTSQLKQDKIEAVLNNNPEPQNLEFNQHCQQKKASEELDEIV
eukprot:g6683.t1